MVKKKFKIVTDGTIISLIGIIYMLAYLYQPALIPSIAAVMIFIGIVATLFGGGQI